MNKKKRVLSLFSGCGGMDIGFEGGFRCLKRSINTDIHPDWIAEEDGDWISVAKTGFETVFANDIRPDAKAAWVSYFSSIYDNANEIYHIDSIVDLVKRAQAGEKVFPDNIDIVTGGFPCQDFSVAGKRKGFNSDKSHNGGKLEVEADKGFLYIGKRISRSLKNESLSGLVPIYDHSLVILADEDEEVQADIAICKSNSGISGSRLAAAHVRLGEKIGRHIATVFPEKNTSILVLERGGRFFGDGVYMGAGGIFYSMNPKQDDAPVINTERVVIVDSVINTGKSIMRIIDELKNHNPGIDVIIAANVIQNEAAELFKDYLVFATRLSKNSFVGVNQSKQTGKTGPDTADRLFNLIKKRY